MSMAVRVDLYMGSNVSEGRTTPIFRAEIRNDRKCTVYVGFEEGSGWGNSPVGTKV
jgi:hypothetical protein